jgi:methylamine dehydrogenase heavy chain
VHVFTPASALARSALLAAAILSGAVAHAQFKPEEPAITVAPPPNPHRAFVTDTALPHAVDGKVYVIDGDGMKFVGQLALGYAGLTALSPDRKRIYVATTYFSRLWRGERTDVIDVYDGVTLEFLEEILIPPKRAQALAYRNLLAVSSDNRFLLVQNATPATSVAVVDVSAKQATDDIELPGCYGIVPWPGNASRFSSVCGDGTLVTVTLDAAGKKASIKRSQPFFDPDTDPVFIHTEAVGDRHYFVSFRGMVHAVDLRGDEPAFVEPWPLARGADAKQGWRPGGYAVFAIHASTGRMFVAMHPKGAEGTHKNPAAEVWTFDLGARKRVGRTKSRPYISIAVTQDARPLLFGLDGLDMGLYAHDATAGLRPRGAIAPLAETAIGLVTQ